MKTLVLPFLGPVTFDIIHNLGKPNALGICFVDDRDERALHIDCWDRTFLIWQRT